MDQELLDKFTEQDKKLDAIYKEMIRAKRWAMLRTIITIIVIVVPLIGLWFAIPKFLEALPDFSGIDLKNLDLSKISF